MSEEIIKLNKKKIKLQKLEIDKETLLKTISPLGGGLSRLRETCGAVNAIGIVIGNLYGYFDPKDNEAKVKVYTITQQLVKEFEDEYHSLCCRDLLKLDHKHDSPIPSERTSEYYASRPCKQYIFLASDILTKFLIKEGVIVDEHY